VNRTELNSTLEFTSEHTMGVVGRTTDVNDIQQLHLSPSSAEVHNRQSIAELSNYIYIYITNASLRPTAQLQPCWCPSS